MNSIKDSKYIGIKMKLRRKELGISQEKLSEMVGVTYQQIQKYEKGINKMNVEMLQKITRSLNVPTDFFFMEADDTVYGLSKDNGRMKEIMEGSSLYQTCGDLSSEEQELIKCFRAIPDKEYRECFLSLLKKAAESEVSAQK